VGTGILACPFQPAEEDDRHEYQSLPPSPEPRGRSKHLKAKAEGKNYHPAEIF